MDDTGEVHRKRQANSFPCLPLDGKIKQGYESRRLVNIFKKSSFSTAQVPDLTFYILLYGWQWQQNCRGRRAQSY